MKLLTPEILTIINALKPHETYLVGGAVRDFLMDKTISDDMDLATTATPEEVRKKLRKARMHVIPTGIKHGTMTVIFRNQKYEITTLREDVDSFGRHAEVRFGTTIEGDSNRRDFTFNALYMDEYGEVYDFHGGVADLKDHTVRFIGNPKKRIEEDHLRLLRYFRFHGKFKNKPRIDKETLKQITPLTPLLLNLSKERTAMEVGKFFKGAHTAFLWQEMEKIGIPQTLGFEGKAQTENLEKFTTLFPAEKTMALNLLCLYPTLNPNTIHMHLSRAERSTIKHVSTLLTEGSLYPEALQTAYVYGKQTALHYYMLKSTQDKKFLEFVKVLRSTPLPELPISGEDLLHIGFKQGKAVGKALKELTLWWLENNFPDKEDCLQHLKNLR